MPVIVVGADTTSGLAILERLHSPERDVRAFVSDTGIGHQLKEQGIKVALGDVSDESHIEAAATGCFTAILIEEAGSDERERSFAADGHEVLDGWARAMRSAGVKRIIWVSADDRPSTSPIASARVDPDDTDLAEKVAELDEVQVIGTEP